MEAFNNAWASLVGNVQHVLPNLAAFGVKCVIAALIFKAIL